MKIVESIQKLIKKPIEKEGYSLLNVSFNGKELVVTISKKEGWVSIEDCVRVSKIIDPIIEKADLIKDSYYLTVSSPGIK